VVQRVVLQLLCKLSALLHCHRLFHLSVQSASRNIQTTFAGLPLSLTVIPSYLQSLMFVVLILSLYSSGVDNISLLRRFYKQFPFAPALKQTIISFLSKYFM
jgi:hypothetical protein